MTLAESRETRELMSAERLRHSVILVEDLSLRPVINRLARLILDEAAGATLFRPAW